MIGRATVAGHFGEWLQGRLGAAGPLVLVTLACPALHARVRVAPAATLTLDAPDLPAAAHAMARRLLEALDLPARGTVSLRLDMQAGGGAGGSTAALVALARALGGDLTPERLARACLAAEGASDPLMLPVPDAHLWAPREGRSLAALPPPPPCEVVGGFLGAPLATDPADLDFPDVTDLVAAWRAAAARRDLAALAALAARSAERTGARRGPADDPVPALAARLGALGHARAHTGSARALLFAPGTAPPGAEDALRAAGLADVLRFRTGTP